MGEDWKVDADERRRKSEKIKGKKANGKFFYASLPNSSSLMIMATCGSPLKFRNEYKAWILKEYKSGWVYFAIEFSLSSSVVKM